MSSHRWKSTGVVLQVATLVTLLTLVSAPGPLVAGGDALVVRVNDATGAPGGLMAIVLRTYASRPVGQGQVCFPPPPTEGGGSIFSSLEEVIVFSAENDATAEGTLDPVTGQIDITFSSASATVNQDGGPLLVVYLTLAPGVTPGQVYQLNMDLPGSFFFDGEGQPIPIQPRAGLLSIRGPFEPRLLGADGDRIMPGSPAQLGVGTYEPVPLSSGRVTLVYDPAVAGGPPTVTMDPRHGNATFAVDTTVPGRIDVDFVSPDASLNLVPGEIVSVLLPTDGAAPPGSYPLTLDPTTTLLRDETGVELDLTLVPDVIELLNAEPIFADGFESGSTEEWSLTVP